MFTLVDSDGKPVLTREGVPFTYSTRELAKIGKRVLETERKQTLVITRQ